MSKLPNYRQLSATIILCLRSSREEGRHHRRRDSGQPRITTQREELRLRVLAFRNRYNTLRSIGDFF